MNLFKRLRGPAQAPPPVVKTVSPFDVICTFNRMHCALLITFQDIKGGDVAMNIQTIHTQIGAWTPPEDMWQFVAPTQLGVYQNVFKAMGEQIAQDLGIQA